MTQEEKAKAYDKAIEMARNIIKYYKEHNRGDECSVEDLEEVFPELKESEDDKIRKRIYNYINVTLDDNESAEKEKWLDWLEKQGEPNPYSGTSFKYNGHTWGMCARDNGVEIIFDGELKAFLSSEKSFIYPIHPQKSLAPKSAMEAIKEEKVDNQNCVKIVDKAEPKFHEGDWITDGEKVWKIGYIEDGMYIEHRGLISGGGDIKSIDKHYHLWTIQDAKDGDVLSCNKEILLFKSYSVQDRRISLYCWYNGQTNNFHNKEVKDILLTTKYKIYPATKEQREQLEKAIADAGYTFDFEKKELKKIHNALEECEIENIEHGKYYYCIKDYYAGGNKRASKGDVVQALKGMSMMALGVKANEYFIPVKNFVDVIPTCWSEEDEHWRQKTIDFMKHPDLIKATPTLVKDTIAWLKSLKDRL